MLYKMNETLRLLVVAACVIVLFLLCSGAIHILGW